MVNKRDDQDTVRVWVGEIKLSYSLTHLPVQSLDFSDTGYPPLLLSIFSFYST